MAHIRSLSSAARLFSASANITRLPSNATRNITYSAVALAKKKSKVSTSEDPFDDEFGGGADELFGASMKVSKVKAKARGTHPTGKAKAAATTAQASATPTEQERVGTKLTSAERLARFNALYQFVSLHTGKQRPKTPQVRNSAWTHLFGLATSSQQMEKVVKLFPQWRDMGRAWTPQIAENFIRRCEELACPQIALQVFTDHPKYGMDLSTLPAARQLLHSLHVEHPLSDSIAVSALYKIYDLPPLSSDLISCAMLASACFKNNTPESVAVAKGLVPSLRSLLEKTPPKDMALPAKTDKALRARTAEKEKAWLAWTLAKIEKALEKQGEDFAWLRQWRGESGHLQAAAA